MPYPKAGWIYCHIMFKLCLHLTKKFCCQEKEIHSPFFFYFKLNCFGFSWWIPQEMERFIVSLAGCICNEVWHQNTLSLLILPSISCLPHFVTPNSLTLLWQFCVVKSDAGFTDLFVFTTFRNCNHRFLHPWLHTTVVLTVTLNQVAFGWSIGNADQFFSYWGACRTELTDIQPAFTVYILWIQIFV